MNGGIVIQYSREVARGQTAKDIDNLAKELKTSFVSYPLPAPLDRIGLRIEDDETPYGLLVTAHCVSLHGRFEHVWLEHGDQDRALGGRVRFYRLDHDGKDGAAAVYEVLFDNLGNMRLGTGKNFTETMKGDRVMVNETFRRLALGLATAIHASLDVVSVN